MCADAHKDSGSLWVSVCLCAFKKACDDGNEERDQSVFSERRSEVWPVLCCNISFHVLIV